MVLLAQSQDYTLRTTAAVHLCEGPRSLGDPGTWQAGHSSSEDRAVRASVAHLPLTSCQLPQLEDEDKDPPSK